VSRAADPGLVVEPSADSLTAFATAAVPDGKELNLPSIALREYDGPHPVTVTRRLTNVGPQNETCRAQVGGLGQGYLQPGFTVPLTGPTTAEPSPQRTARSDGLVSSLSGL
jgi:hypothetical protein